MEQWQRCQEKLKEVGFEEEETDQILKKAFGWAGQGYWRKSKVKEVPSAEQLCPCIIPPQTLSSLHVSDQMPQVCMILSYKGCLVNLCQDQARALVTCCTV